MDAPVYHYQGAAAHNGDNCKTGDAGRESRFNCRVALYVCVRRSTNPTVSCLKAFRRLVFGQRYRSVVQRPRSRHFWMKAHRLKLACSPLRPCAQRDLAVSLGSPNGVTSSIHGEIAYSVRLTLQTPNRRRLKELVRALEFPPGDMSATRLHAAGPGCAYKYYGMM